MRESMIRKGSEGDLRMVMDTMLKSTIGVSNTEDLVIEAVRDLVKDEIKKYIRQKIDQNQAVKKEMKEAVAEFIDAKAREAYALVKLGKCAAELGIQVVPPEMREKLGKDLASLVEKEMSQVFEKM